MSDQSEKRRPGHIYDPAAPLPEHLKPEPEPELPKRRLKDSDSSEVAYRLRAFTWSLTGLLIGALVGVFLVIHGAPRWVIPVCALGVWALAYFGTLWFAERAARVGSSLYFSSGSSTPAVRQYSLADSMIVRGRYDDAAAELERAAAAYPHDPEPCLRLARLLRDSMNRHDDAVSWFRQGISRRGCDASTEIAATRELIEIYTHRLKTPRRAMPDLARLATRHPDTPAGAWARRLISDLKQEMREENQSG